MNGSNPITHDATATALAEEVAAAREAIVDLCERDPGRVWHAFELKAQARNGWRAGAMTLALNRLLDDGVMQVSGDCVQLRS